MWKCFVLLCFYFVTLSRGVSGSLADKLAEATQLCCNHGTAYARNRTDEDCSSSVIPVVLPAFESLCMIAMDSCCKDYFVKKSDCDAGIRFAINKTLCDSSSETKEKCCKECGKGTEKGSRGENCEVEARGKNDEELLAVEAFIKCCKKAEQKDEKTESETTEQKKYDYNSTNSSGSDIDECALGSHNCVRVVAIAGPDYQCKEHPDFIRCVHKQPSMTRTTSTTPDPMYEEEYYVSNEVTNDNQNQPSVNRLAPKPEQESTTTNTTITSTPNPIQNQINSIAVSISFILPLLPTSSTTEPAATQITEPPERHEEKDNITNVIPKSEFNTPEKRRSEETRNIQQHPETTNSTSKSTDQEQSEISPAQYADRVGEETANVQGEKAKDVSVVVDTGNNPKNKWMKVNDNSSKCKFGFEVGRYGACYDVDECSTNRHRCSRLTETCRNVKGGYICDCAPGFRRDLLTGVCDIITTSSSTTSTTLPPPRSSTSQSYLKGYPEYRPPTTRPFRPRNICGPGYHLNSSTGKCEDINECTNGQANCAGVEICVNTEGGYRCECPPNWRMDEIRHRCLPVRSNGQFPSGYGNVPDIDECSTGQASCGARLCTNLPGGYICSCPPGHKLVGGNRCEDVDECTLGGNVHICSQNADCVNTVGSYQCRCHTGFRSAPVNDKVCVDVDECTDSPLGSLCQQRCNNVWGGYRCSCHRGYRLNPDNSTCSDIDECTAFKSNVPCVGRCLNEPGSYRCTCPQGYRLSEDKKNCIDIDECQTGEAPCAKGSISGGRSDICVNTRGGFRCHRIICPTGYQLESKHRCTRIDKFCQPADWECAHQPSTYSYNFATFVSKLHIPDSKVDLFTMKGPIWPNAKTTFTLRLVDVNAPPTVKERANINSFILIQKEHQAVIYLVRSLEGPQSIELELSMEVYLGEQTGGIAVARLYIFISEYEF